jgi:hypothetical protein
MTSAPAPATSAVLSRLPDPRTAVVTGAGGPAGIGRITAPASPDAQDGRCADDPAGCRTHRQHVLDYRLGRGGAFSKACRHRKRRR